MIEFEVVSSYLKLTYLMGNRAKQEFHVYLPQAAGVTTVIKRRMLRHLAGFQFNTFCCLPQIL